MIIKDDCYRESLTSLLGFKIPGLGLIFGIICILIEGMITSNVLGKKMTDVYSMGFITKQNIEVDVESKTVVFIPTTPNPTSGFLVYLNKGSFIELDIPVDIALKSIVSLGSVYPDIINSRHLPDEID